MTSADQESREVVETVNSSEAAPCSSDAAPTLAQRMVHPALLQGSKIMNLGSAAQRFGSENLMISPKNLSRRSSLENTPSGSNDGPRPFSLAEAMQAARKLNLDNDAEQSEEHEETDNETHDNDELQTPEPTEEMESLGLKERQDEAKNIEIRRLSNTDEGNKVLEPSFHSPEKEEKKNPLGNLFNIVSGMEPPPPTKIPDEPRFSGPSGFNMIRPLMKSKKRGPLSVPSPIPHNVAPPWTLGHQQGVRPVMPHPAPVQLSSQPQVMPGQPGVMIQTMPHMMMSGGQPVQLIQTPVSGVQQPMYQMVQTVNGTMLVQMPQQQQIVDGTKFVQIQPNQQLQQQSPSSSGSSSSSKSSSPSSSTKGSPSKKKDKKRKLLSAPSVPQQQAPVLMSPNGSILQTVPPAAGPMIAFNPVQPQLVTQNMVINPGQQMIMTNGTIMAMPQTPGIMYQQLADGSLVQMQSQVIPQPQQIISGQPLQGQVLVNNQGQFMLAPQGMVQAVGSVPNQTPGDSPPKRKKGTKKSRLDTSSKSSSSDTSMETDNTDNTEGVNDRDSVDDTDTSFEEPQPSTSRDFSPRSSIQSNQVDSSGLNATPPHQKDAGEYEQLRSETTFSAMNTSLESSMVSRQSQSEVSTPNSDISMQEEPLSCDSDLDQQIISPRPQKINSSKKKKKKKKKRHHSSHGSSRPYSLGDIVWGPINGSPSWPGKVVSQDEDRTKLWVCWFQSRQVTQIEISKLKSLSEGLEDHHRERKNSRRYKLFINKHNFC